jgi:hypothetical protein
MILGWPDMTIIEEPGRQRDEVLLMKLGRRVQTGLPLLLIVALAAVVYGGVWTNGVSRLSPHSDIVSQHLGTKTVLWRSLEAGHGIPFWRDDELSGAPGLTNPQSLYTNPLHLLFFLVPPEKAMGPTLWLQYVTAGVVFYFVGGMLRLGRAARFVAGLAAMFSYKLIAINHAGWLPVIPAVVFVPLLIGAVLYVLDKPGPTSSLVLAGAGVACLHSGHLQLVYYAFLFLIPYVLVRLWRVLRARGWTAGVVQLLWLGLSALLAVGSTAYLLVPVAAEAPLISRGNADYAFFLGGHSLRPAYWLGLLTPSLLGQGPEFWEDIAYFGIIPLALGVLGVVLAWRRSSVRFLAISFLASTLLTVDTPLLRVAYGFVPGFSLFRCPSRFLFLAATFGIALSAIGTEELLCRLKKKWPSRFTTLAAIAPLALVMAVEAHGYAVNLLAVDPWVGQPSALKTIDAVPQASYRHLLTGVREPLPDDEKANPGRGTRVAPLDRTTINYGWAAPMGLQLITGYDSYNFRHYQAFMDILRTGRAASTGARVWTDLAGIARTDLLEALDVRYIVARRPQQGIPPDYLLQAVVPDQPAFIFYEGIDRTDIFIYARTGVSPTFAMNRAYWAKSVEVASTEDEMVARVLENDLRETAVIGDTRTTAIDASSPASVHLVRQYDGHLELDLASDARRFLVISEVWHPGWRATLDGERIPLVRANIALMGAWVPAGTHRMVLEFRPILWAGSLAISLLSTGSILGLAGWILLARARRKR